MKKYFKIINAFIFITLSAFFTYYFRFNIICHDDFQQAFINTDSFKSLLFTADHGRYLSWLVMKFVIQCSSQFLHIHPNNNFLYFGLKGCIFSLLFYFISKLFYINSKDKTLNPIIYISVSLFSLFLLYFDNFRVMDFANQHFGYIFNLLFFFPALFIIGRYFIYNIMPDKKEILGICFILFLPGISAHFNIIVMSGVLFLLFTYLLIEYKPSIATMYNFLRHNYILLPIISFVFGGCCSIFNPNFQYLLSVERHPAGSRLNDIIYNFNDFTHQWFYYVFCQKPNGLLVICIISILAFLIYKEIKNKNTTNIRSIYLALSLCFGAAFFNYTLIICGKTYGDFGNYWLIHKDLQLITNFFFLSCLIILMSILTKYVSYKKVIQCFFIVSLTSALSVIPMYIANYNKILENRKLSYVIEKATIFYSLKKANAIIVPKNYMIIIEPWLLKTSIYETSYFKNIYGYYPTQKFKPSNDIDYLSGINKDGLYFSDKELKELNFTKLLDKDFVLNKKSQY